MPFADCLALNPVNESELRIYDDLVAKKVAEGIPEEQAQREAIEERLGELETDKADVFTKVNDALPEPITPTTIEVEEITDAQEQQRLIEEYAAAQERIRSGELPTKEIPYTTISGGSPDIAWSDSTGIRRNGAPAVVYRGSRGGTRVESFASDQLAQATNHPTAGLGVYFTSEQADATGYGEVVDSIHLDIRNPRVFTTEEVPEFTSPEEAFAYREDLREQGHDGIVFDYRDIEGPVHYVAFDAEQVINTPVAEDITPIVKQTLYQAGDVNGRVESFAENLESELGLTSLSLFADNKGNLKLNTLIVPKADRNVGKGTEVMNRITEFADRNGLKLTLTPAIKDDFQGTTSRSRLVKFYKRFGFVENKGRNKDFTISESMFRKPQVEELLQREAEEEVRAAIRFTEEGESIMRLTRASDLSSFLHESGHLFLEMERRFAEKFGTSEEQQVLLDWLEVESFDELNQTETIDGKTQYTQKSIDLHEKFSETFEVYLRTGKAPSLKLREAFAAFARWLTVIYRKLTDSRLAGAKLTPEIREYMDRMLATETEIEQATSNPAYDQLFRSQEQAGMTDAEWVAYEVQSLKAKNTATVDLNKKLIDELTRRKTREWKEEREPMIEEETERLSQMPAYEVFNMSLKNPMDSKQTAEQLGIKPGMTTAERFAASAEIDLSQDSLLVAAAKRGGLNMAEWSREFVDQATMKDKAFNNQVFGRPIFRKKEGMNAEDLAEMANELGYAQDISANDVLDLVDQEIRGEPVYTAEGYAIQLEREEGEYYGELDGDVVPEKKGITPTQRLLKRITSADGVDPAEYAEAFGYTSVSAMINDIATSKPIKKAAYDAAESRMIEKYGDMLNDGSIEIEARESVHNEEQAKLLLQEIKALSGKKKSPINRAYLKAEAANMIDSMTYREMKPSKFYRAEIRAAENAVMAQTDTEKLDYKIQQLANHYMYRMTVDAKEKMDKHRKQVRGYETRQYSTKNVEASYAQNIKMLSKSYNMRKGDARKSLNVEQIVSWMITQLNDSNNYVDLTIIDPLILKMITDRQNGLPVNYELPAFNELTSSELKGLVEQLRHMRFVGGKLSDTAKTELGAAREAAAESVREHGGKVIPPAHEKGGFDTNKDAFLEFGYSHRRIGGIFETLDGFKEGGPMEAEYNRITDASNTELRLTNSMAKAMDEAFKGVLPLINKRKRSSVIKEDGVEFALSHRARFVLGLNWGNESNRETVLEGLNAKFSDSYTEKDIVDMLSTMTTVELEALNKVWAAKETLWPEMSAVEVRRKGVAPRKIDPAPITINGVKLTGGHYRLHYRKDPSDTARKEITTDRSAGNTIKIATASSMNERVGSGGRQVDLELSHLFQDIQEQIHYVAFAELSDHLNSMFKGVNNPLVESIISRYGEPYYDNLAETLGTLTQPEDPAKGLWKGLKYVRSNLTYAFLVGSLRNIIQQPIAATNAISQLGEKYFLKGIFEFYRDPVGNWDKIGKLRPFMKNRTALVNREAREQLLKIDSIHPKLGAMKNLAFLPQTFMDSLIAYPAWFGARSKYRAEHPKGTIEQAEKYADEMVAKTIGSGLPKDVGAILNKGEAEKQITFMGTFFNLTWNLHVENAQLLKRGRINPMEYARRLGWMAIAPALIQMWLLDDVPEDDDEIAHHALKEIAYYNMSSIFLVRDMASAMDGFTPSIPGLKFADGIVRVGKEMRGLITGDEELDAETVASIIRGTAPLVPLPVSGQIARTLEGMSDPEQGTWGALVEGKERN